VSGAVYPDPISDGRCEFGPGWQFDVKLDLRSTPHRIGGRYSRHHDVFTVPTVIGSDQGDGVIYSTNVQNGEWNTIGDYSTKLWTNRSAWTG